MAATYKRSNNRKSFGVYREEEEAEEEEDNKNIIYRS